MWFSQNNDSNIDHVDVHIPITTSSPKRRRTLKKMDEHQNSNDMKIIEDGNVISQSPK